MQIHHRFNRTAILPASLAALVALTAACGAPNAAPVPRNPVVKIGVILSLTGPDAPLGVSQLKAIELADRQFSTTPGPKFDLTIMNESGGAPGVNKLIGDGVSALLGPTHSSFVAAVYSQLDIAGVPTLGMSLTVPGLTAFRPFLWRVSLSADRTIPPSVADASNATHATTAFLIYTSNDLYTIAEKEIFESSLSADGVALLGESSFVIGQPDLAAVVKAAKDSHAGLICIAAESIDAVHILRKLRASGVNQTIVGGNGFNSSTVIQSAGAAANNVYVGGAWNVNEPGSAGRGFVTAFRKAYGSNPDSFAAQAYVGMQVLRAAVRRGGTTRADIQSGLHRLKSVATILGPFSFDISRDAVSSSVVNRIMDGKLTLVSRSPASA